MVRLFNHQWTCLSLASLSFSSPDPHRRPVSTVLQNNGYLFVGYEHAHPLSSVPQMKAPHYLFTTLHQPLLPNHLDFLRRTKSFLPPPKSSIKVNNRHQNLAPLPIHCRPATQKFPFPSKPTSTPIRPRRPAGELGTARIGRTMGGRSLISYEWVASVPYK